jgi:hypothetical protein
MAFIVSLTVRNWSEPKLSGNNEPSGKTPELPRFSFPTLKNNYIPGKLFTPSGERKPLGRVKIFDPQRQAAENRGCKFIKGMMRLFSAK